MIMPGSVSSAPAGYRFPREVIAMAVRWYLRYSLSYRDIEELLAERGITVDHVTVQADRPANPLASKGLSADSCGYLACQSVYKRGRLCLARDSMR